jgi:hypothetical protein
MKSFRLGVIFLTVCLVLAPASSAWTWSTHQSIADSVYYSLPNTMKSKLSLTAMKEGSIYPDKVLHDTKLHSYPASYNKAVYWLNKGTTAYKSKNYYTASKYYGIASHYISDTFSAPHCVSGEQSSLHTSYEKQAAKLTPRQSTTSISLLTSMKSGYTSGKYDWDQWLKTKKSSYVQTDLNRATTASTKAIKNSLGVKYQPINKPSTTATTTYVGNFNSKIFHKATCSYVNKMSSSNKIPMKTRTTAIKAGYVPCKVCKP